jgi:hypothetical protein
LPTAVSWRAAIGAWDFLAPVHSGRVARFVSLGIRTTRGRFTNASLTPLPNTKLCVLLRSALVLSAMLIGTAVYAPATHAQGLSGCTVVDVTGGSACPSSPTTLSPKAQALLSAKTKLASEYTKVRLGKVTYTQFQQDLQEYQATVPAPFRSQPAQVTPGAVSPYCISKPTGGCVPSSASVSLTQQSQANYYYCGPATASEILGALGSYHNQSDLASDLHTTTNGTDWYPEQMAPTLNSQQSRLYYQRQDGSASGMNTAQWESDLTIDISTWGQPIAGNLVEYSGGIHLVGHPQNQTIGHWIAIYGYNLNGQNTLYGDSVSGDSWIWSWAANVPPYSSFSSSWTEPL